MVGDDTNVHKDFDADGDDGGDRNAVNASPPRSTVREVVGRGVDHDMHPHVHGVSQHTDPCSAFHDDDGDNKDPSFDDDGGGPSWPQHNRMLDDAEAFVSTVDGDRQQLLLRLRPQLPLPKIRTRSSH